VIRSAGRKDAIAGWSKPARDLEVLPEVGENKEWSIRKEGLDGI
jgi:hypothetical protein